MGKNGKRKTPAISIKTCCVGNCHHIWCLSHELFDYQNDCFYSKQEDGNAFPQHDSFLQHQIYETKKYFQDQQLDKKLGRSCCTVVQHTSHHLEVVGLNLALIFSYFICYFQPQVDCP